MIESVWFWVGFIFGGFLGVLVMAVAITAKKGE